jgi:hypothetical protein
MCDAGEVVAAERSLSEWVVLGSGGVAGVWAMLPFLPFLKTHLPPYPKFLISLILPSR